MQGQGQCGSGVFAGGEEGVRGKLKADAGSNGLLFQSHMQCSCEGISIYGNTWPQDLDGDVHDGA